MIGNIPLAVCHVHMEASVTESRQRQFAAYKNEVLIFHPYPLYYRYDPNHWESFANPYFALCKLIDQPEDFGLLTEWILEDYKQQNVIFVELIFSPELARDNCKVTIDWRKMLHAAQEAMTQAESDKRMKVSGVVTFLRGPENPDGTGINGQHALEYVQYIIEHKEQLPNFRGVHLSGDENTYPHVKQFAAAYELAQAHQLGCSAHAGETGNPQNMWNALRDLNLDRIGHGIAAAKDAALRQALKAKKIPLEICVSSNFCLSNVDTLSSHPLPELIKSGVECLFGNTDDDRLFNTDPLREIQMLKDVFGFTDEQIIENTRRIIKHGFLPEDQKMELLLQLDSL